MSRPRTRSAERVKTTIELSADVHARLSAFLYKHGLVRNRFISDAIEAHLGESRSLKEEE